MRPGVTLGRPQGPINRKRTWQEVASHRSWGELCHSPRFMHLGEGHEAAFLDGARAEVEAQESPSGLAWHCCQVLLFKVA